MNRTRNPRMLMKMLSLLLLMFALPVAAADEPMPDPDGKPADMTKPVQVYILLGQSNMVGSGVTTPLQGIAAEKYPYLVDDSGAWTVRKDVRNVFIMASGNNIGKIQQNNWMTIERKKIGPEIGLGHHLGNATDAPVLILKSCIGNRSLGWDLLPPGTEAYEHGGKLHPGYRGTPDNPKGDTGGDMAKGWYAGCQYDGDIASAKHILENLGTYYPGATEYEVKGFFWWQGCKEKGTPAHYERYGQNLVQLIRALRKDFDAPDALFVAASLGETKLDAGGADGAMINALIALAKSDHEELKGKVGFVYSNPLSMGGGSCGHYGNNVQTYMNVGEGMGKAMVELIEKNAGGAAAGGKAGPAEQIDHQPRTWTDAKGNTVTGTFVSATKSQVVIELENGRKRKFSRRAFSEEDQAYLDKYSPRGE